MNEKAIEAVSERVRLGRNREQIVAELQAAGYPAEEAVKLYQEVIRREAGITAPPAPPPVATPTPTLATAPDSIPTPPTQSRTPTPSATPWIAEEPTTPITPAPPAPTTTTTPRVPTTPMMPNKVAPTVASGQVETGNTISLSNIETTPKSHLALIIVLVVLFLTVTAGVVYGAAFGGFQKAGNFFAGFSQSAPYATEAEMMEGLILNERGLTAHGINLDFQFAIEEREEETKLFDKMALPEEGRENFDENISAMIEYGALPAEVDIQFNVSGLIDDRNKEQPEFDLSGNLHVLAEPFILNTAGSIRLADGVLYGKIDDIPANFKMYLGGMPTDTWVIMANENQLRLPANPSLPIRAQQVLNKIPPQVLSLFTNELERLASLPVGLAQRSQSFLSLQAAQLGAAPLLDASMSAEEAALLERSLELLKEFPIIKFVGEPERIKTDDGVVYAYEVDFDFENIQSYFFKLVSESEAITGQTIPITETELRASFGVARPLFDEMNRLTDFVYTFRSDSTLAGISVGSKFTFDHPDMEQQFRFEMDFTTTRQNDALDIEAPEGVYEKTMEEIMEEQMSSNECFGSLCEARKRGQDASIKSTLSNVRSQAEIHYNNNNYSYTEVCSDERIQQLLFSAIENYAVIPSTQRDGSSEPGMVVCNDEPDSYALIAPLTSDPNTSFCVDSSGYAFEVSPYALSSGTDTSCSETVAPPVGLTP